MILTLFCWRIENHILSPSPYFAGVLTVYNDTTREIEVDGDKLTVRKNFFPNHTFSPFTVTILFDEIFYNTQGTLIFFVLRLTN